MKHKKKTKRSWKNDKTNTENSSSDSSEKSDEESEKELSFYAPDCIKLMEQVFKILGDKKLKKMTPQILKSTALDDLKADLVEECMALSVKRKISVFNGNPFASSSSESEKEATNDKDDDIISLDDISDDSDIVFFDNIDSPDVQSDHKSTSSRKSHKTGTKKKLSLKDSKHSEKKKCQRKRHAEALANAEKKKKINSGGTSPVQDKAMSALELLELQARARAIKSQLALEIPLVPIDPKKDADAVVVKKEEKSPSPIPKTNKLPLDIDPTVNQGASTSRVPVEPPKPKKVKLRRDHHPTIIVKNSSSSPSTLPLVKNNNETSKKITEKEIKQENLGEREHCETNKKKNSNTSSNKKSKEGKISRSSSSDSLIIQSPSHPLVVISSEEDETFFEDEKAKLSKESQNITPVTKDTGTEPDNCDPVPLEKQKMNKNVRRKCSRKNRSLDKIKKANAEEDASNKNEKNKTLDTQTKEANESKENSSVEKLSDTVNEKLPKTLSNIIEKSLELIEKPVNTRKDTDEAVPTSKKKRKSTNKNIDQIEEISSEEEGEIFNDEVRSETKPFDTEKSHVLSSDDENNEQNMSGVQTPDEELMSSPVLDRCVSELNNPIETEDNGTMDESDNIENDSEKIENTKNDETSVNRNSIANDDDDESSEDNNCIIIDSATDEFDEFNESNKSKDEQTSSNNSLNESGETEERNLTWKSRWLESKRVQNVLQTSKLYNNMKRRVNSKVFPKKGNVENAQPAEPVYKNTSRTDSVSVANKVDEGSVGHFQALKNGDSDKETNGSDNTTNEQVLQKNNETDGN